MNGRSRDANGESSRTEPAPPRKAGTGRTKLILILTVAILAPLILFPQGAMHTADSKFVPQEMPPPRLSADPAIWLMESGTTASFSADWLGTPADCVPTGVWYFWNVNQSFVGGLLNTSTGPSTQFTADSALTGITELTVQSAIQLDCTNQSVSFRESTSVRITIVAPLVLTPPEANPVIALPGERVELVDSFSGGQPPYHILISFGDGSEKSLSLESPGTFSVSHSYGQGTFLPEATVTDSGGANASLALSEPLQVTIGPAAAIRDSSPAAELDRPLTLSSQLIGINGSVEYQWTVGSRLFGTTPNVTFADPYEDNFTVTLQVLYINPPLDLLALEVVTTLMISVTPPPNVSWTVFAGQSEATASVPVSVEVQGGVAPYQLRWQLPPTDLGGALRLPAPGSYYLLVPPSTPGNFLLTSTLVDSNGAEVRTSQAFPAIEPALNLTVTAHRTNGSAGVLQNLQLTISGGVAPFCWVIVLSTPPTSASPLVGQIDSDGSIDWTGLFQTIGDVSLSIFLLDASFKAVSTNSTFPAVSPLVGSFSAVVQNTSTSPVLNASVALIGGFPPFHVTLTVEDTPWIAATVPSDGSYFWTGEANQSGTLRIEFQVEDSVQETLWANRSVIVVLNSTREPEPPPPNGLPPPTASPAYSGLIAPGTVAFLVLAGLLAFVGSLVVIFRSRRRPTPSAPEPIDATEVIHRLVIAADGVERGSLELLAEDEGLSIARGRATIDRLVKDGSLRSELGVNGEELLTWVGSPPSPEKPS